MHQHQFTSKFEASQLTYLLSLPSHLIPSQACSDDADVRRSVSEAVRSLNVVRDRF